MGLGRESFGNSTNNGDTRICAKCGLRKPISEFEYDSRNVQVCHECYKEYHKAYYQKQKSKNANKRITINPKQTKTCVKCGKVKPQTDFYIDKANGRLMNTCKSCKGLYVKKYYLENKEDRLAYAKEYSETHKEQLKAYQTKYSKDHAESIRLRARQWELDHPDYVKARRHDYYKLHFDEFKEKQKQYAEAHKQEISERARKYRKKHAKELAEYHKKYQEENAETIRKRRHEYSVAHTKERTAYYINKRNNDPLFKLSTQIRGLIRASLKNRGYSKDTHTYEILGCDYETLWSHLRKTWLHNYGAEWNGEPYHIDHIKPLATAKTKQEVIELCNYKNLQLLKPHDNLTKNKYQDWERKN